MKFRRQFNIGYWIVDFYCHELKLIIELDGSIHFESEEKIEHDRKRQSILEKQGYSVIRYTNYKILDDTNSVVNNIIMVIDSLSRSTTPPNLPL